MWKREVANLIERTLPSVIATRGLSARRPAAHGAHYPEGNDGNK